jgi:RecB family exonuclease
VRAARAGAPAEAIAAALSGHPDLAGRIADASARGAMEAERLEAARARRPSPFAGWVAPAALAPSLPDEWTPSQLEQLARCPFRLLADLGFGLREPRPGGPDIDRLDEGRLVHAILERFFRERIAQGLGPVRGAPGEVERLRAAAQELFERYQAEGRVGDPAVWAARRGAVLARLERVLADEVREAGGLAPALVEHRFGAGAPAGPLVLADGDAVVRLRGRIDRVDAGPDRLLVLDYKDSSDEAGNRKKLDEDELGVTNFQLPAYLLAAARELPGRRRLEAGYVLLRGGGRLAPVSLDADDPLLAVDEARRAEVRAAGGRTFADAVLGAVARVRAGELPAASRSCEHCRLGAVCRVEALAEAGPGEAAGG